MRCLHGLTEEYCAVCKPRMPIHDMPGRARHLHPEKQEAAPRPQRKARPRVAKPSFPKRAKPYATIEEASEAVQRIPHITGPRSYWKYCVEDPHLPRIQPDRHYGKRAWKKIGDWSGFTGRNKQSEVA